MKVFRSIESFEQGNNPVVTIGTYDGVHLGHRTILSKLKSAAENIGGESVIISFHPHPRLVLYPDDNPLRLLQTIDEKIDMLKAQGIDKFLLIPFTKEFSRLSSEVFIEDVLVKTIGIKRIIIGYDHQFGRNREGGLEDLRTGSGNWHYEVEEIPAQQIDNANISSTKIRNALLEGDIETANKYLGYDYPLSGTIVEGEKLGRTLGFPTANISPNDSIKLIPGDGVYFVEVFVEGRKEFGMMNIGKKPTAGEFGRSIEVNILNFEGDLYGKEMTIQFQQKIRNEKKFDSLDVLKSQLKQDQETVLSLIKTLT